MLSKLLKDLKRTFRGSTFECEKIKNTIRNNGKIPQNKVCDFDFKYVYEKFVQNIKGQYSNHRFVKLLEISFFANVSV